MHVARRSRGMVVVETQNLASVLLVLTLASTAPAKYSGGTGEPNDPYQIATAADLIALGETPADYDKHFILTADIDLDPNLPGRKVFDKAVIAPDVNDTNGGFDGTPFTGVFDGNDHAISHVTIDGKYLLGLFGRLGQLNGPRGEVKKLGLVDVTIVGTGSVVGGLVGLNYGSVVNCHSTGSVSGSDYVGGLVGDNWGSVTQCYSSGVVSGSSRVGGLVGYIDSCVRPPLFGSVTRCYSTGTVTGNTYVGGLVGLIGYYGGCVTHCYSTGAVNGTGENVGGLVGCLAYDCGAGAVIACLWDVETSGQMTSAGGQGRTTSQMQTGGTFAPWGACGPLWTIDEGHGYPHLAWEGVAGEIIAGSTYGGGTGTVDDPYLIHTPEQLNSIGSAPCHWDKHFKLMADIDLSGLDGKDGRPAFNVIGSGWLACSLDSCYFWGIAFTGVFDGNGHTISSLTIQGPGWLGLFGWLASGAEVKNLGVADVNVTGSGGSVGGLVGYNGGGTVIRCYCTGRVSAGGSVGGLVGWQGQWHV